MIAANTLLQPSAFLLHPWLLSHSGVNLKAGRRSEGILSSIPTIIQPYASNDRQEVGHPLSS
jgi:hypothetical protein